MDSPSRGGITAQFNTPSRKSLDRILAKASAGRSSIPMASRPQTAIAEHVKGTPMAELRAGMRYRDDVSPLLDAPFWRESSVATYAKEIERSGVRHFHLGQLAR